MYRMEIKIFGQNLRIEIIIACVIVGYILGGYLLCSCAKITIKEGFSMLTSAPISYQMGADIPQSWEHSPPSLEGIRTTNPNQWYNNLEGNNAPEPNKFIESGSLDILADNSFKPSCCPSLYSSSSGCACISPEQMKYMNQHGGNRTFATEF